MVNADELYKLFNDIDDEHRCLYTDTFSSLCFLHLIGHTIAANKLLKDLLKMVNQSSNNQHSKLINNILKTLPGHEKKYAFSVTLRSEFKALFQ